MIVACPLSRDSLSRGVFHWGCTDRYGTTSIRLRLPFWISRQWSLRTKQLIKYYYRVCAQRSEYGKRIVGWIIFKIKEFSKIISSTLHCSTLQHVVNKFLWRRVRSGCGSPWGGGMWHNCPPSNFSSQAAGYASLPVPLSNLGYHSAYQHFYRAPPKSLLCAWARYICISNM